MFKTKRRRTLEQKELELYHLKQQIIQMRHWCAYDSPEIAFAMLRLESMYDEKSPVRYEDIGTFRDNLRKGLYTFQNYSKRV